MRESPSRGAILVLEDEGLIAMLFEDILLDLGYAPVIMVPTVDAALRAIQSSPIRFAILDVNIGGQRSFPVAEALAAQGIPFLFSTGYGEAVLPDAFRGVRVIAKPFREQDVKQALDDLVSRSG